MAQRPKLTSGIKTQKIENRRESAADHSNDAPSEQPAGDGTAPPKAPSRQPSRQGKVPITVHFDPLVRKQIKSIGVEHDKTMQQLMAEAVNMLFATYGRPEIALTDQE